MEPKLFTVELFAEFIQNSLCFSLCSFSRDDFIFLCCHIGSRDASLGSMAREMALWLRALARQA